MDDENAYQSLAAAGGDARWAFGTGFEDPLHGVDDAFPAGLDEAARADLATRCVTLGDDALVSAQRLAEWCTRAPELEVETALANIGLDLLGQARLLYSRAGRADGTGRGEDDFAYLRGPEEFRNVRLAELPNGDFAFSVARLLVLSSWRLGELAGLTSSPDPVLAAVAAKAVPELAYHREYAAGWAVRLGDGTEESRARMGRALGEVAPWLPELYAAAPAGREPVEEALALVASETGLAVPGAAPVPGSGRDGDHTGHLAPLLAELQSVARAHPGAVW
ncbi:1,2-phenylacetyl-CoA epoxidase subunit PaaC [Bailinhaonella thermotolerans]|uniref:Phenylacetate-CoA oxygenase subunit PaaI n=1 Tax=Bailinhaonella thermotolerans TaxID=1070861 RepID=A0A3A4B735_9ACTN|nr:1,2-phenylacetyl-CoA epoxidase subunit PaaC [Bailinhaonella thermotolerans]RJL34031.1 phenylacetate-CoA oxygenase subunit PaaI [Bailinhaonella thermotolerans]